MKLIIGLGNKGKEYDTTRHNAGFEALDTLADKLGVSISENKHKALVVKTYIAGEKVLLMKPQTYMNLSGESVRAALDFYKLNIDDILVIYDDISLDVGRLRIRLKGSAGGHNGIKSIISHLGSEEFSRIKIGVGDKEKGSDLAKHVLGKFNEEESKKIKNVYENIASVVELFLIDKTKAMNLYNGNK